MTIIVLSLWACTSTAYFLAYLLSFCASLFYAVQLRTAWTKWTRSSLGLSLATTERGSFSSQENLRVFTGAIILSDFFFYRAVLQENCLSILNKCRIAKAFPHAAIHGWRLVTETALLNVCDLQALDHDRNTHVGLGRLRLYSML